MDTRVTHLAPHSGLLLQKSFRGNGDMKFIYELIKLVSDPNPSHERVTDGREEDGHRDVGSPVKASYVLHYACVRKRVLPVVRSRSS
jgi:hypothetical protein